MRCETLISCFAPPLDREGHTLEGDFGWVCGFTANPDILAEMADRFTNGARRRRPSLGVFLHPPPGHMPLRRGVHVLFPRGGKPLGFNLLHAKVALLRFVGRRSSMLRLVVSTGNWTHEPLETSIDLFWIAEWRSDAGDGDNQANAQAAADIRAAADMFDWLRPRFDTSVLEVDTGQGSTESGLLHELRGLPIDRTLRPRFIDTRTRALDEQILDIVAAQKAAARKYVIFGSGYYETCEDARQGVLTSFVSKLRERRLLTAGYGVEVVLNPDSCQGLAGQMAALTERDWTFRPPFCSGRPGARLHAKFVFSASGDDSCHRPWCYIGSGNLSEVGFTRGCRSNGNLEAGVVFVPKEQLRWVATDDSSLGRRLPADFGKQTEALRLQHGEDFPVPGPPAASPPVSYLHWHAGYLSLPEGADPVPGLMVAMPDGTSCGLPAPFAEPPSKAVLLPWLAEVPVLVEGGFVLPPLPSMRVEDVLQALTCFPQGLPEERDGDLASDVDGEEDAPVQMDGISAEYPLRRMMRLIVGLTETQAKVAPNEWERWVNRLEELLSAVTEAERDTIATVRDCGIDPLGTLLDAAFLPDWLGNEGTARLAGVLDRLRSVWKLDGLEPLFPHGGGP